MKPRQPRTSDNIPWKLRRHGLTAVSTHGKQRKNTSGVETPDKPGLHETERKLVSPPPRGPRWTTG
ncbi:hypothetical protein K0M31_012052 [Melipona bicolor]|uniref:Uncharacterized protein n=1 Tax=Melipona bicolor TaxID=60889 RepID=A0AA40KVG5_9HYME|nr:hypothetical protein K0M31_012052 [Melipona bicolor]